MSKAMTRYCCSDSETFRANSVRPTTTNKSSKTVLGRLCPQTQTDDLHFAQMPTTLHHWSLGHWLWPNWQAVPQLMLSMALVYSWATRTLIKKPRPAERRLLSDLRKHRHQTSNSDPYCPTVADLLDLRHKPGRVSEGWKLLRHWQPMNPHAF